VRSPAAPPRMAPATPHRRIRPRAEMSDTVPVLTSVRSCHTDGKARIARYLASGLSKSAIPRQLGISRRVIYHWLRTGQLDRDMSQPVVRRAAPRGPAHDPGGLPRGLEGREASKRMPLQLTSGWRTREAHGKT